MTDSLAMQGLSVEAHNDSDKALQRFRYDPTTFDLLITDQTMLSTTGLELLRKLRSIRADLPVILCTGFSDVVSADNATDFGVDRFLQKPVEPEDLIEALMFCLSGANRDAADG